jgi:hypothetical protein
MKTWACDREPEVAAAVRAARLEGAVRDHARSCRACGEAASVTGFLQTLAEGSDAAALPAALPDPSDVYRRARLAARLFRVEPPPVERAIRRLALAEALGIGATGAALLSLIAWAGNDLWQRIADSLGAGLLGGAAVPQAAVSFVAVSLVAASVSLLAMLPLLREE